MRQQATESAVLDAVLDLLARDDQRLTYDAVAKLAGVARQTVYTHFPTRADLLVAAVERAREVARLDDAVHSVYEAPTAVLALRAYVDVHVAFVPTVLRAYTAVERERSIDPDVEAAFARRTTGRRRVAHLVATRLCAEGDLAAPWTVDTACDVLTVLTSGSTTTLFLREAGWSTDVLRQGLLDLLSRALLASDPITRRETP